MNKRDAFEYMRTKQSIRQVTLETAQITRSSARPVEMRQCDKLKPSKLKENAYQ